MGNRCYDRRLTGDTGGRNLQEAAERDKGQDVLDRITVREVFHDRRYSA